MILASVGEGAADELDYGMNLVQFTVLLLNIAGFASHPGVDTMAF